MKRKLALAGGAALLLSLALTGCESDPADDETASPPPRPATTGAATPPAASTSPAPDEDNDDDQFPPAPSADNTQLYLRDLRAVDPDVVEGAGEEGAVTRGRAQCVHIYNTHDDARQLVSVNIRFATKEHPDGFGDAKAEKINTVVKKYICPKDWR